MIEAPRPASHQNLPDWMHEGARVYDPDRDREAVIQFVGPFEDPETGRYTPCAVFLRPEGGGIEWIVPPDVPRPAATR